VYLKHFGLKSKPFLVTPETEAFFTGGTRHAFWESLIYVLKTDDGIFKVVGEVGSGKTTVCRYLLKKLPPKRFKTIYFADPTLSREQMLYALADGLDLVLDRTAPETMILKLQKRLAEIYASERKVVLLIDEAHAMPEETLDQLRLLSQVEASGNKIMQILLFGPEELDHNLALPELRPVRERITQSFRLRRLNLKDISQYLAFKLKAAGYEGPPIFTGNAIKLMVRLTNGVPRRINILADKALLSCGLDGRFEVKSLDIIAAAKEIKLEKNRTSSDSWLIGLGSFFAGAALSIAMLSLALSKGWVHIDSPFDRREQDARVPTQPLAISGADTLSSAAARAAPTSPAALSAAPASDAKANAVSNPGKTRPNLPSVDSASILSGVMDPKDQGFSASTPVDFDRTSGDSRR
jgi:MSHA biogenesis protein MshM